MKVGIACPYSWEVPGGVQAHIRDFTEELSRRGHTVSVLAPGEDEEGLPPYITTVGRPVAIPYNGSVARVAFGPRMAARVRRWLVDGQFDIVHVHEPATLSVGLITTWWAADTPIVGTSHSSMRRSRAMSAAQGILKSAFEKFAAHIAVSEEARRTVVEHLGIDAVLIPNGLYVDRFAVPPRASWQSGDGTLSFLGRLDEPRKGLQVLLRAWPAIHDTFPKARLLVAGRGEIDEIRRGIDPRHRDTVEFLGGVSDEDKAAMLASSDIYVAPHIGGESFGIVLAEAMAAGAPVLASDLEAFRAVLDDGRLGALVPVGDASALAAEAIALLGDDARRDRYRDAALTGVRQYDWSRVTDEILAVYEMAIAVGSGGHAFKRPGLS